MLFSCLVPLPGIKRSLLFLKYLVMKVLIRNNFSGIDLKTNGFIRCGMPDRFGDQVLKTTL